MAQRCVAVAAAALIAILAALGAASAGPAEATAGGFGGALLAGDSGDAEPFARSDRARPGSQGKRSGKGKRRRPKRRAVRSRGGPIQVRLTSLVVRAPRGAIRKGETLTIERGAPQRFPALGIASVAGGPYTISTSQGQPRKPVEVSFAYDPRALSQGGTPLVVHGWSGLRGWVPEPTSVDRHVRRVSAAIESFSPLDVVDYATWLGGRLTHNRSDLPGNCGEVPEWINGASFPMGRNEALPACVSNRTDAGALKINVVNNRGYAQLVTLNGARLALERSGPWSDSVDATIADALSRLNPANGPGAFVLAAGASATIAIERPLDLVGERQVTIQAAPRGGSAVAQVAWALLKKAREAVSLPAGVANCVAGVIQRGASGAASATGAFNGLYTCVNTASGLSGVGKAALKRIAAAILVTDLFQKVADLTADEAFPARVSFAFKGKPRTSTELRIGNLNVGAIPAGAKTLWRLSASGGSPPYAFAISTIPKNIGRAPEWVSLAADGELTIEPPPGTDRDVSFYVFVSDSAGQRSATGLYEVSFTVLSGDPGEEDVEVLPDAIAGYLYQANLREGPGEPVREFEATGLPAGFRLGPYGTLAGIPRTPGTYSFKADWTVGEDQVPQRARFELEVVAPPALPERALPQLGVVNPPWWGAIVRQIHASPDGRYLAVVLGVTETVVLYDTQAERLEQLTWGIDRSAIGWGGIGDDLAWSPDGRYLAFTSTEPLLGMPANGRWYNVYLYDLQEDELRRLTDGTIGDPIQGSSTADAYNPVWSPDGELLAFTLGDTVAVYDLDAATVEPLECSCRAIASLEDFSSEPWSADSQHLTLLAFGNGFYDVTGALAWDRATGSVRTIADGVSSIRASADGEEVFVSSGIDSGQAVYDVATGALLHSYPTANLRLFDGVLAARSVFSPDDSLIAVERCPVISSCEQGALEVASGQFLPVGNNDWAFVGWRAGEPIWCRYDDLCRGVPRGAAPRFEGELDECTPGYYCEIVAVDDAQVLRQHSSLALTFVVREPW